MFASGGVFKTMDNEGVRGLMHKLEDVQQYEPILKAIYQKGSSGCSSEVATAAWVHSKLSSSGNSSGSSNVDALGNEALRLLSQLYHGGYLIRVTNTWNFEFYCFPTPLHYSYYLLKMYTTPYHEIQLPSPENFEMFVKQSIARMSSTTLRASLNRRTLSGARVYERQFQVRCFRNLPAFLS